MDRNTQLFLNQGEKLKQYAEHLRQGIEDTQKLSGQTAGVSVSKIVENIKTELDFKNGGLLETPQFSMPSLFSFLLKYEKQNPDSTLKKGIETTLNRMARGGIYDHLGGGFSRYSTDSVWGGPHFEQQKPPFEVCIVGKNAYQIAKEFKHFDTILLMAATNTEPLPLLKNKLQKGKTMVYICQNKVCNMPTTNLREAIKILKP